MPKYEDQFDMMGLLRRIGPMKRTLASNETDRALEIVAEFLPGAQIEGFSCGSKAWTWTLPMRWEVQSARIEAGGTVLVDYDWHPLHLIDYSQPFSGEVSHEELMAHLHTDPKRPHAIPFVFSFYEPVWGFAMPHNWLDRFNSRRYRVEINVRLEQGNLNVLAYHLPGESERTFVICSNICHPTQVNDSLTGVAVAVDIARRLQTKARRKYSYLVLVLPETIGSITYFANHPEMVERAVGGFFSEMLGTDGPLVGQRTRRGNSYWDKLLEYVLANSSLPHKMVNFLKSASNDEKVLDSPGVDIPTFSLTRMPYPEYHTSDDNINLIDIDRLRDTRDALQKIIDFAEEDYIPVLNQPGPVFLSGHGLYPNWRDDPSLLPMWQSFIDVMYSIDGVHSVIELAIAHKIPISHFFYWVDAFAEKGLLTKRPFVLGRKAR